MPSALDRLNVWRWQADYPNPPGTCDGTGWSVEIVYADKAIVSHGTNCFPGRAGEAINIGTKRKDDTFRKFCQVVSRLVGGEFN
jgi:hypothetical protein